MDKVKEIAKAHGATQASVVDSIVAWALALDNFDVSYVASGFVKALPRGRKAMVDLTPDQIQAQIDKLSALLEAKTA